MWFLASQAYMVVIEVMGKRAGLIRPGRGWQRSQTGAKDGAVPVKKLGFDARERGLVVVEVPLRKRAPSPEVGAVR